MPVCNKKLMTRYRSRTQRIETTPGMILRPVVNAAMTVKRVKPKPVVRMVCSS